MAKKRGLERAHGLLTLATGGHQLAKHRNGRHADQAAQPDERDDLVGMVDRLPGARSQRMAYGVVAFAGYCHQSPGGDGHRGGCNKKKKSNYILSIHLVLKENKNLRRHK